MTAAAISADVSGPDAVRKASCVSQQLDRGVQICEIRTLARDPLFEVVNMATDFSALEANGRNYVAVGHAQKARDGLLEIPVAAAP